jgi:hypothetical protein
VDVILDEHQNPACAGTFMDVHGNDSEVNIMVIPVNGELEMLRHMTGSSLGLLRLCITGDAVLLPPAYWPEDRLLFAHTLETSPFGGNRLSVSESALTISHKKG